MVGWGVSYVKKRRKLFYCGTFALLSSAIIYHATYNLLVQSKYQYVGILLPIVTKVFPADSTLLIIGVSACLAGAVMGDHCSPISDTSIMASAGAQCDHISHISTQLPYVLTVAAVSFVSYLIAGFVQNVVICLVIGVALTIATLFILRRAAAQTSGEAA
jgi:Na+/H+ antiporter NhaC